jgi:hypothetical protein
MLIKTGTTVNELVLSFDTNNNPVLASSFTSFFYINGILTNSIFPSINLVNITAATYSVSWSASTYGFHQLHLKNDTTSVLYVSDIYSVRPDNEVDPSPTIYVGL